MKRRKEVGEGGTESREIFRASDREGESDSPGNWKIEPAPPPAPSRESVSGGCRGDTPFPCFSFTHERFSLCIDGDDSSDKNQNSGILLILYLVEIYTRRGKGMEERINQCIDILGVISWIEESVIPMAEN